VIEMQWTPEVVKAEMDYRLRTVRHGVTAEHLRAARRAHKPLWHRILHR
jgi:hypothetical protein